MSEPLLHARGLVRTYHGGVRELAALRDVSIEVATGDWVAVTGPSGCGKSTLLHLLGGLDRPDRGEVWLAGHRMDTRPESERAMLRRRHVGFVFQFLNLVPTMTVAGNVELPLVLQGVGRRDARRRVLEVLDELGVAEVADAAPAELSGGQQQRVALARAVVHRPDVLLADEPTGALDSAAAETVLDLLRRRHQEGQSIVLVTHDHRVAAAADRVVTMLDGQIADERDLTGSAGRPAFGNLIDLEG
ncbi:ABC transporter ATP-binding protein [Plantactinospora sp. KLBMP9567]|uniref:ABC transporter ATP-binding protein n=1 Tax=Plantactinospora sp. KLBMP9567 TaxID=3085900 RepID=UPI0029828C83|nr:ABC transporter ATP-binding protein [Plantactinospora sp. KLBMP9567]MDW5322457.1 ABC transporter ATP-binding protein [Plantactinospora sp. KLBMP9567]